MPSHNYRGRPTAAYAALIRTSRRRRFDRRQPGHLESRRSTAASETEKGKSNTEVKLPKTPRIGVYTSFAPDRIRRSPPDPQLADYPHPTHRLPGHGTDRCLGVDVKREASDPFSLWRSRPARRVDCSRFLLGSAIAAPPLMCHHLISVITKLWRPKPASPICVPSSVCWTSDLAIDESFR